MEEAFNPNLKKSVLASLLIAGMLGTTFAS